MGAHIVNGQFQSDKYPACPPGKVPISVKDPTAQDLLWKYAQRRRQVDAEFANDLEALLAAGYMPALAEDERTTAERWARTIAHNGMTPDQFARLRAAMLPLVREGRAGVGATPPPPSTIDREYLGRIVREVWVAWAREQPLAWRDPRKLLDAAAIARGVALPVHPAPTEAEARDALSAAERAYLVAAGWTHREQAPIEGGVWTRPDRRHACITRDALSIQRDRGNIPADGRATKGAPRDCNECGGEATKTGTTGTFCDTHADTSSRDIPADARAPSPAPERTGEGVCPGSNGAVIGIRGWAQCPAFPCPRDWIGLEARPDGMYLIPPHARARGPATLTKEDAEKQLAALGLHAGDIDDCLRDPRGNLGNVAYLRRGVAPVLRAYVAHLYALSTSAAPGDARPSVQRPIEPGLTEQKPVQFGVEQGEDDGGNPGGGGAHTGTIAAAPDSRKENRLDEPDLTAEEHDLALAAIPLQTGLTHDGQRAIKAVARCEASGCGAELNENGACPVRGAAWEPTVGAKVITAARLTGGPFRPENRRARRAGAAGVLLGGWGHAFRVRHDDGTEAPYDANELAPAPAASFDPCAAQTIGGGP